MALHPSKGYIASIDQGTSSSRFMIFNHDGNVVASHQMEHTQHYPEAGFVEHDAMEIWDNVVKCAREALSKARCNFNHIKALGITNQRETTIIFNRHTGKPYHRAIVWNDTRTAYITERLCAAHGVGGQDQFRAKTGLPIATYFSAFKIMHLLETIPGLRESAERGDALFGTIDTWLVFKLTCGKIHATDVTNASRTMLMNLRSLTWDPAILSALKIPPAMLPQILSSSEVYGRVLSIEELSGVPISGVLGDQHAALFGQTCFEPGDAKCTYGTGAFLLLNTGAEQISSTRGLLTTMAYQLGKGAAPVYALEGSVAYCGSLIQWLRDNMDLLPSAEASEEAAKQVVDNGGVYFVPAFSGLYAPYWRSNARGIIAGLTAFNTKHHIVRAALEAAAFQAKEVLEAMELDSGVALRSLRVDGGMTNNHVAMQFQCNLVGVPLHRPLIPEMTALGAAFAAGLAVGYWSSTDELKSSWRASKTWTPAMEPGTRTRLMRHWRKAVSRALHWVDSDDAATSGEEKVHRAEEEDLCLAAMQQGLVQDRKRPTTSTSFLPPFAARGDFWWLLVAATAVGWIGGWVARGPMEK